MNEFRNKQISVIGAARSGIASAAVLVRLRAQVLLSDSKTAVQLGRERLAEIEATGASAVFDAAPDLAIPLGTDLVVTSPGVPRSSPVLQEAVRRGIPVWSEIELACRIAKAPILATTGTNGKTTTTILIGRMLDTAGFDAVIAGNVSADEIKLTLVEAAAQSADVKSSNRVLVAEISSFQLEWVERFAPRIAILTNITPDHLNRHAGFNDYAQTKARLFAAQQPTDWALVNYDDRASRAIGEGELPGRRAWFTRQSPPPDNGPAAWIHNGEMVIRLDAGAHPTPLLRLDEMPFTLPGAHNIENVLAAGFAAAALGASPESIAEAVKTFQGVPHRMELVAEVDGVRYVNNSMCTNVGAAISSIGAMDRPTVVIAGGADKDLDYAPLAPAIRAGAKAVVLIGSAADKIEKALRADGYDAITRANSLDEAIAVARSLVSSGEAILLSPACASFDMFSDFEERGRAFRSYVHALKVRHS